jgi:hypothetical protein
MRALDGLASARPVEDEDADADSTGVHVLQDVADLFPMVMDVDLFAGIPSFFFFLFAGILWLQSAKSRDFS